jgi:hypothetical protein
MSPKDDYDAGDILRVPAYSGGYRVYEVTAVLLGGDNQESVVELVTLDRESTDEGRLLVPIEILSHVDWEDIPWT